MKKRIPNLDLYIETSDFNCTSTPTETNIEVGSRFVTCATRDGSGESQTIKGEKTFINKVIFQDNISVNSISSSNNEGVIKLKDNLSFDKQTDLPYDNHNKINFDNRSSLDANIKEDIHNKREYNIKLSCDKTEDKDNTTSYFSIENTYDTGTSYTTSSNMYSSGYQEDHTEEKYYSSIYTKYYRQHSSSYSSSITEYASCTIGVHENSFSTGYRINMSYGRDDTRKYFRLYGDDIECISTKLTVGKNNTDCSILPQTNLKTSLGNNSKQFSEGYIKKLYVQELHGLEPTIIDSDHKYIEVPIGATVIACVSADCFDGLGVLPLNTITLSDSDNKDAYLPSTRLTEGGDVLEFYASYLNRYWIRSGTYRVLNYFTVSPNSGSGGGITYNNLAILIRVA